MKRTGMSYAKAASEALEADPALYSQYEREIRSGSTFEVPEQPEYMNIPGSDSTRILNKGRQLEVVRSIPLLCWVAVFLRIVHEPDGLFRCGRATVFRCS